MSISQDTQEITPLNNELPLPIQESSTQSTVLPKILVSHEAEFIQVGNDLMIKNPNESEIIKDYFVNPVPIKTVEGLILSVDDITTTLNSPSEPILLAANDTTDLITTAPPAKIGIVSATAEGPITAQDKDGAIRVLHEGDAVYLHDLIVTPANSYVKITLLDDTLFQLGPNSRASLDKYAFDPAVDLTGEFETFIFSGAFRYVSGKISGNNQGQHTLIKTPSADIGIRGSEIDAVIGDDGSTTVLHLSGLITIRSHYQAEEILVYERGTSIYIPNHNISYTVNQLTESQIQQKNQEWQIFRGSTYLEDKTSETIGINKPTSLDSPTDSDFQSEQPQPTTTPQANDPRQPSSPNQKNSGSQPNSDAQPDKEPPSSTQENGPRHPFSLNQIDPNSDESVDDIISEIRNEKEELIEKPARLSETINRASPFDKPASIVEEKNSHQNENQPHHISDNDKKNSHKINQPQSEQDDTGMSHFQGELPPRVDLLPPSPTGRIDNTSPTARNDNETLDDNRFDIGINDSMIINAQTLLENDTDPNRDPLTIITINNSLNGTAEINEDGDIVFTRGPNFDGNGEFEYQISDGKGGFDTARVFVTGTKVDSNRTPTATDDNSTTDDNRFDIGQNNTLIIKAQDLLENDTDPDSDPLTIIAVNNSLNGTAEINEDGDIVFTRDQDFDGNGEFEYQISDGQGGIDTARVFITGEVIVVDDNRAPIARNDNETADDNRFDMGKNNNLIIKAQDLLENDSDPDGDSLTITEIKNSLNGTAEINEDGDIVFTRNPDFDVQGKGEFEYQISDGKGGFDTASVFVTGEKNGINNHAPIARDDNETLDDSRFDMGKNDNIIIKVQDLLENDIDTDGDPLTIIEVDNSVNGTAEINEDGDIVFTRDSGFEGTGEFEYQISDGKGGNDTARVSITGEVNVVGNRTPIARDDNEAADDERFDMAQNNNIIINAEALLENDTDLDSDPLTITLVNNSLNGTAEINEDGDIVFTRGPNFDGTGEFEYQISDGNGGFDTARVIVTGENRTPIARNDNETLDDSRFDMGKNNNIIINPKDLLENDSDPNGDHLVITLVKNSINGTAEINEDGNIVFTRGSDFKDQGGFEYQISDGKGGFDTATVTIIGKVAASPIPIVARDDGPFEMGNNESITLNPNQLLNNDDGESLTITNVFNRLNGTATIDTNGDILFTRNPDFNGQGEFDYQIIDTQGNIATATVTLIGKVEVNQPPLAQDDGPFDMGSNEKITLSKNQLFANDSDPDGDSLTLIEVKNSLNGEIQLDANGDILFTRNDSFNGQGEFEYQISDSKGGTDTATVTVIGSVNSPPEAQNDGPFDIGNNESVTLVANQLLGNDTDPDGDSLTIIDARNSLNGTVEMKNGNIMFTRADSFNGQGEFEYEVSDGKGGFDTATVTVIGNRLPKAEDDGPFDIGNNESITLSKNQLLGNDSDPDGDPLIIIGIKNSVNGQAIIDGNGDILFTRGPNFDGTGEFEYEVSDGQGGFDTARVTVRSDNTPIAIKDEFSTFVDTPLTISAEQILDNDIDPDGDPSDLSIVSLGGTTNGSQLTPSEEDDSMVFKPASGIQEDSFAYTIQDSDSKPSSPATVTITISGNPLPDNFVTNKNNPLTFQETELWRNDENVQGQTVIQVQEQTVIPNSSLTINAVDKADNNTVAGTVEYANGQFTFTPTGNYTGEAVFEYTLQDALGRTKPVGVTIKVDNTPPDAMPDTAIVTQNSGQQVISVLENDSDNDPGDKETLIIQPIQQQPADGTVDIVNNQILFTPNTDFVGETSFDYVIADRSGATDSATVTVNVNPLLDAMDDEIAVIQNTAQNPISVLNNDTGDQETLTIESIQLQQMTNGSVEIVGNQILFTPSADFVGTTSFDYIITDKSGETDSATVTIKVETIPPVITLPSSETPLDYNLQNQPLLIDSSASVSDQDSVNFDGGTLEIAITQNRSRYDVLEIQNQGPITVSSSNGGVISYNNTPIGNFSTHFATGALLISFNLAATPETTTALLQAISYKNTADNPLTETRTVEFTLTDGDGGTSNTAVRQIEVTLSEPVSPQAVDDQIEIPFNQPVSIPVSQLLDNDKPVNPDEILHISEELSDLSPGVEASVVGDEVQLFIDALSNDNIDEVKFDYTIIDNKGSQDTATVTLTAKNVQEGSPDDDLFTGTEGTDIFQGQEGNDTFQPSIGPDILSGGENDDLFLFDPSTANGVHISGDAGLDTLRLTGADNQRLDLLQNRNLPANQQFDLQGLEKIDLSAGTNNELRLSLQDVLDITDDTDSLIIDGNESSRIISTGEGWNPDGMDASGLYNRYTNGDAELLVSADISNQFIS